MRLVLALGLALVCSSTEALGSIVTKTYHFQFADGNFDVTSESGIDYSGLFTSGIDYTVEYDDAGTFYTQYDRSTPPNPSGTVHVQPGSGVSVLSDAIITHNALSLFDSTGFTPRDGTLGAYTYSLFQLMSHGSRAWINNELSSYVNFATTSPGVHRTTFAFYWTKDGVNYSDRITGLGPLTPDDSVSLVPEASALITWSVIALGCCLTVGRRRLSFLKQ